MPNRFPHFRDVIVFRRPGRRGWWLRWYDDEGKRRRFKYPSREAALRTRQTLLARLNGWTVSPADVSWDHAIAEYELHSASHSPRHQRAVAALLRRFTAANNIRTLADCTQGAVETYLATLEGKASDTKRQHWAILHAFFSWAVARRWLGENPITALPKPARVRRLRESPAPEEWVRLLEATRDPKVLLDDAQGWYLLVLLAAVTGLRRSALLAITIRDVELRAQAGILKAYTPKTKKESVHGLPEPVCNRIAQRINELPDGSRMLFGWRAWQRKAWERLLRVAGISITFHSLRASSGAAAALARIRAAGAAHLDHSHSDVFASHYEGAVQTALAVAAAMPLPELPPMPRYGEFAPKSKPGRRPSRT